MIQKEGVNSKYEEARSGAQAKIDFFSTALASLVNEQRDAQEALRQVIRNEDFAYIQRASASFVLRDAGKELAKSNKHVYLSLVDPKVNQHKDVELSLVWGLRRQGNEHDLDSGYSPYEKPYTAGIQSKAVDLRVLRNQSNEIEGIVVHGSFYLHFNESDKNGVIVPSSSPEIIQKTIEAAIQLPSLKEVTLGDVESFANMSDEKLYARLLNGRLNVRL